MITALNEYQCLTIHGVTYTVTGMIAYEQGKWEWKEYLLKPSSGSSVWLSIEVTDEEAEYVLYSDCGRFGSFNDAVVQYEGYEYHQYEGGVARVTDYFGRVDVDRYEQVSFADFQNEEMGTYLSIEDWEGEKEYSFGRRLSEGEIRLEKMSNPYASSYSSVQNTPIKRTSWVAVAAIIALVAVVAGVGKSWLNGQQSIQRYLEKNINYSYVTSVTNNTNNKKAKVYQTDFSVDEAVTNILKGTPKGVKSVLESVDENGEQVEDGGVGLMGNREYAYVYVSDSGATYVQVSSSQFMEGQSDSYRAANHTGYYYRTYYRRRAHSAYSSVLSSVRQSSVSSRRSSGGGTSSGK